MDNYEQYIESLCAELPNLCTPQDLVKMGMYSSVLQASYARRNNFCPEYFQLSTQTIRFPKQAVINFLRDRKGPHAVDR